MDIQLYISRARKAMSEGEFDLARRYFNQVLSAFPENEEALKGLKDLEVAVAKKSWSPVTWWTKFIWGVILKNIGQYERAYNELKLVFQVKPNNTLAAFVFAGCAEKTGHLEDAHKAYQRVLANNATHQSALQSDAELLAHMDRLDEAVELYQRLEALRPKDDRISHRLRDLTAKAYSRVGIPENLKERRAKIEKEKREAPGAPEFVEKLNEMLTQYKNEPHNKDLGVAIAAHYREGGHFNEANRYLAAILDEAPDYEPARREQARVWRQSGELNIAVSLFEELLSENPDDLTLQDEYNEARIALLKQEREKKPANREIQNQIQKLTVEREKNRIKLLSDFLEKHPEAEKERAELGEILLKHGRIDEAIAMLQRLIHTPRWAGKGLYLLGECFRAQGDYPLAITQFEKALNFFKNKGYSHVPSEDLKAVYYYMGLCKEALSDKKGAREAFGNVYSSDIHYKDVRERYEATFK